jgi:hypothetical protein
MMLQDHVTQLALAVLIAAHSFVLIGMAAMAQALSRRKTPGGWRLITPSGSHWFAAFGSWTLSLLISWVWLFVGSARCDAIEQMRWAFLLSIGFALGAGYMAFHISDLFRMGLRLRGDELAWSAKGAEHRQSLRKSVDIAKRWTGFVRVQFADGATLDIDPYASGATDLLDSIEDQVLENSFAVDGDRLR